MKESYGEGLATHAGPESYTAIRKGGGEALTRERIGQVFSCENALQNADAVSKSGRQYPRSRKREALRSSAQSKTLNMYGNILCENRENPCSPVTDGVAGRVGKSKDKRL